jgi:hypothetical protein
MKLLLIIIIMFTLYNGCAQQNKMKIEEIMEIWVYDYFDTKGYTRGEVYRKFQELEIEKKSKFIVDSTFTNSMKKMLLHSARAKKLLHGKCGTQLIFAKFVMKDNSSRNIIICSVGVYDYFVGYMQYNFDKDDMIIWVSQFFNKIKYDYLTR